MFPYRAVGVFVGLVSASMLYRSIDGAFRGELPTTRNGMRYGTFDKSPQGVRKQIIFLIAASASGVALGVYLFFKDNGE